MREVISNISSLRSPPPKKCNGRGLISLARILPAPSGAAVELGTVPPGRKNPLLQHASRASRDARRIMRRPLGMDSPMGFVHVAIPCGFICLRIATISIPIVRSGCVSCGPQVSTTDCLVAPMCSVLGMQGRIVVWYSTEFIAADLSRKGVPFLICLKKYNIFLADAILRTWTGNCNHYANKK